MPKVMTAVVSCLCPHSIHSIRNPCANRPSYRRFARVVFIRLGFLVLTTRSAEYISTIVFVIGKPYKVKSYDDTVSVASLGRRSQNEMEICGVILRSDAPTDLRRRK